jgi:predicted ribosomally synthesized peptide with SipW-like signal peptide
MTRKQNLNIKKRNIRVVLVLFIAILFGITASGTYAYFTDGEKILPEPISEVPQYNEFQVLYSDHSESQTIDDGITVYFDISSILISQANQAWSAPTFYYYITGTRSMNNGWTYDASKRMRFDENRTVSIPTDVTKVNAMENNTSTGVPYSIDPSSITWSGCWVKMFKLPSSTFNIVSGENRFVIVHVGDTQTANNIQISQGVKEVYIKNAVVSNTAGGSNKYAWDKLEIKY